MKKIKNYFIEIEDESGRWSAYQDGEQRHFDSEREAEKGIFVIIENHEEINEKSSKYKQQLSTIFAITAFLLTVLTMIISVIGKDKFLEWNNKIDKPFKENEFIITIILGAATSILAGLTTLIFRRQSKK